MQHLCGLHQHDEDRAFLLIDEATGREVCIQFLQTLVNSTCTPRQQLDS